MDVEFYVDAQFYDRALALNKYGLLSSVSLFAHRSQVGATCEVLLSFALAYRTKENCRDHMEWEDG